ncbi:MAG: ATP-binding protein [Planctomycetota bacterium]|nr:ATP-binding protein [Planctomycetota bacterium]
MKSKTLCLLFLVVILPTTLLSWGGLQLARQQSIQVELQVKDLMRDQLTELDSRITRYFSLREAAFEKDLSRGFPKIDSIRNFVDSKSVIENILLITVNDTLVYPNPLSSLNQRERQFHAKIKTIVEDGDLQNQVLQSFPSSQNVPNPTTQSAIPQTGIQHSSSKPSIANRPAEAFQPAGRQPLGFPRQAQSAKTNAQQQEPSNPAQNQQPKLPGQAKIPSTIKTKTYAYCAGWYIWYWGRGVQLIHWQRISDGTIIGVALERSRWMSDLITELPDSIESRSPSAVNQGAANLRSTKIINANGETVYQWGSGLSEEMVLAAEIPVSHPLAAWKLQMWVMPEELKSQSMVEVNIVLGIIASSIALGTVTTVFVRDYTKEIKEAGRRVSFVNQVSHELRTPLTNIRMYAELLDQDLQAVAGLDAKKAEQRIQVVQSESERLSRLIGNVLTFASSQKNKLEIHPAVGVIDDCVEQTLSSFTPNMEKLGIQVRTRLNAKNPVYFDSDALRQIVGNLISNVEKYANSGKFVEINTHHEEGLTVVSIKDDGPGISPNHIHKIFEPFWRLSNELQQASGTGIGLSISRELAKLHGGNLVLDSSNRGAHFVITIKTESAN